MRADRSALLVDRLGAVDPAGMTALLTAHRVLALLGRRAVATATDPDPAFAAAVDAAVQANRARGLALEALGGHVAGRLAGAGIRALPLKGPFLARRLYDDAGMRATHDLDMLVGVDDLPAAIETLGGIGFRRDDSRQTIRANGLPDLHHVLVSESGRVPRIELHWRVHWYETGFARRLLDGCHPAEDGLLEPDPADELAALLLFHARDGFYGLRTLSDVVGWWDRYGDAYDPGEPVLERHWADHPPLRRALYAAATVAQDIAGVPLARLLPGAARADRRVRLAAALARPDGTGDVDQLAANIDLVDGLLAPRGGAGAFVQRHLWLAPGELRHRYGVDERPRVRAAASRTWHAAKTGLRYGIGAWQARAAFDPRRSTRPQS